MEDCRDENVGIVALFQQARALVDGPACCNGPACRLWSQKDRGDPSGMAAAACRPDLSRTKTGRAGSGTKGGSHHQIAPRNQRK